MRESDDQLRSRIRGLIIGTAVGDGLGLPGEGFGREKLKALGWGEWRHRFVFGRGMVSDDTEHTLFVAQSLITFSGDSSLFQKSLAWKLRLWLLGLPAGIGKATLRSILKLCLGYPPSRSGVWSAGNGPAMRSAVIGARFCDDVDTMLEFVKASTVITHTDPRAETGAAAIALCGAKSVNNIKPEGEKFWEELRGISRGDDEWCGLVDVMEEAAGGGLSVGEFVCEAGFGDAVSGYVYQTVPVAIYAWMRHWGDFSLTMTEVLDCGGDTDTVGAIAGALAGCVVGEEGIDREWVDGLCEWPRGKKVMVKIADSLAKSVACDGNVKQVGYFWPGLVLRNILFVIVIFGHLLLRILPVRFRRKLRL